MESKVTDYVRTDKGYIVKIDEEKKNLQMLKFLDVEYGNIVKHSNNIIDLIEKNDYVNGKLVSNVDEVDKKTIIKLEDGDMYSTEIENDSFIKSIVTHEQFSSLEYII